MYRTIGQRVFGNEQMHPLLRAGLVGHWIGGGSGLTWFDRSGYGNHGVLTSGPLWTLGEGGKRSALAFDGVNDHVIATNTTSITSTQTSISVWVKFNALANNPRIIDMRDATNGIQVIYDGTNLKLVTKHSQFQSGTNATQWNTPVVATWYHIAAVFDSVANTTKFYVNGIEQTGAANTVVGNGNAVSKTYLGIRSDLVGTSEFNGVLDDVRIYNRALTQAEIITLATAD